MVQQHVVVPQRRQDVQRLLEPVGEARPKRRILERGGVDRVDERVDPREVDRPVDPVQVVLGELELRQQELREVRRAGLVCGKC